MNDRPVTPARAPSAGPAAPRARPAEGNGARTVLDRAIGKAARPVAWLAFAAMAISVYEVFMRYALGSPTSWVHETTVFLIAMVFAVGGPVVLARDRHIRVRLIYDALPPRLRRWLGLFNDLATLLFCSLMSYAAYVMFWRASHNPLGEWQLERSGTSWNPPFPALTKGIILAALLLMTLQALLHVAQSVRGRHPDGMR